MFTLDELEQAVVDCFLFRWCQFVAELAMLTKPKNDGYGGE